MTGAIAIPREGERLLEEAMVRVERYFKVGGMNMFCRSHFKYLTIPLHDRESGKFRRIKCTALVSDTVDTLLKLASTKLNDLVDQRLCRLN